MKQYFHILAQPWTISTFTLSTSYFPQVFVVDTVLYWYPYTVKSTTKRTYKIKSLYAKRTQWYIKCAEISKQYHLTQCSMKGCNKYLVNVHFGSDTDLSIFFSYCWKSDKTTDKDPGHVGVRGVSSREHAVERKQTKGKTRLPGNPVVAPYMMHLLKVLLKGCKVLHTEQQHMEYRYSLRVLNRNEQ